MLWIRSTSACSSMEVWPFGVGATFPANTYWNISRRHFAAGFVQRWNEADRRSPKIVYSVDYKLLAWIGSFELATMSPTPTYCYLIKSWSNLLCARLLCRRTCSCSSAARMEKHKRVDYIISRKYKHPRNCIIYHLQLPAYILGEKSKRFCPNQAWIFTAIKKALISIAYPDLAQEQQGTGSSLIYRLFKKKHKVLCDSKGRSFSWAPFVSDENPVQIWPVLIYCFRLIKCAGSVKDCGRSLLMPYAHGLGLCP